jgi:hypothetical protein
MQLVSVCCCLLRLLISCSTEDPDQYLEELMNELVTILKELSRVITDLSQIMQSLPCSSNTFISLANFRVFVLPDPA